MNSDKLIKLGEIINITSGYALKSEMFNSEGKYPVVRIRDVDRGFSETYYIEEFNDERYFVCDGDILVGMDGEFRARRWRGGKAILNQRVCKIEPLNDVLDGSYLLHLLPKQLRYIEDHTPYVTVKHLSIKDINEIKIPLPPLEEQKRIAAILDKADALRQKRRESIRLLDEFLRSVFLDMFGENAEKSKYIALEKLCIVNPSKFEIKKSELDLEASFLPMSAISEDGVLDLSKTGKVYELKKSFTYFREGDVLFAKITPSMENGKGGIAENLLNKIGFGTTELHVLRPMPTYKSSWLYMLLSSKKIRMKAENFMTGTAGQQRVPEFFLRKLKVPQPDTQKMEEFDKIFYAVKNEKEEMKKSYLIYENLFNSLVQRAFRGEL